MKQSQRKCFRFLGIGVSGVDTSVWQASKLRGSSMFNSPRQHSSCTQDSLLEVLEEQVEGLGALTEVTDRDGGALEGLLGVTSSAHVLCVDTTA
eukprot:TRINITY_DN3984_c0_g1_i3.p1 TRINITY_DN3984_c0_g1~~TRINITY_DN3984_c0_g1_i3.p1  ORF type:complete len:106 (-),score=10.78 TRINITY_DN3984_c0_g1_i3:5-286(-)